MEEQYRLPGVHTERDVMRKMMHQALRKLFTSSFSMRALMAPSSSPKAVALLTELAFGSVSICTPFFGTNSGTCTFAAA